MGKLEELDAYANDGSIFKINIDLSKVFSCSEIASEVLEELIPQWEKKLNKNNICMIQIESLGGNLSQFAKENTTKLRDRVNEVRQ